MSEEYDNLDGQCVATKPVIQLEVALRQVDVEGIADEVIERVHTRLGRDAKDTFNTRINDTVDKVVDEAVAKVLQPLIEDGIRAPMQMFDRWGKPTGESRPIADMIVDLGTDYLGTRLDPSGDPVAPGHYNYAKSPTRLERMVKRLLDEQFDKLMQAAVKNTKAEIQEAASDAVDAWLRQFKTAAVATLTK